MWPRPCVRALNRGVKLAINRVKAYSTAVCESDDITPLRNWQQVELDSSAQKLLRPKLSEDTDMQSSVNDTDQQWVSRVLCPFLYHIANNNSSRSSELVAGRRTLSSEKDRMKALLYFQTFQNLSSTDKDKLWKAALFPQVEIATHNSSFQLPYPDSISIQLIKFIEAIDDLFGHYGILTQDVPLETFCELVQRSLDSEDPTVFFSRDYTAHIKGELYGENRLPLLVHKRKLQVIPTSGCALSSHIQLSSSVSSSPAQLPVALPSSRSSEGQSPQIADSLLPPAVTIQVPLVNLDERELVYVTRQRQQLIEYVSWSYTVDICRELREEEFCKRYDNHCLLTPIWASWIDPISVQIHQNMETKSDMAKINLSTRVIAVIALKVTLKLILKPPAEMLSDLIVQRFNKSVLKSEFSRVAKIVVGDAACGNPSVNRGAIAEKEQDLPHSSLEYKIKFIDLARSIGSAVLHEERYGRSTRTKASSMWSVGSHTTDTFHDSAEYAEEILDKEALEMRVGGNLADILIRTCCLELPRLEASKIVCQEQHDGMRTGSVSENPEVENFVKNDDPCDDEIPYNESLTRKRCRTMIQHPSADMRNNVLLRVFRHEKIYITKNKSMGFLMTFSYQIRDFAVQTLLSKEVDKIFLCMDFTYSPMIQPPLPWNRQQNKGAYFLKPAQFIRHRGDFSGLQELLLCDFIPVSLEQSTHRLGMQPWQINGSVLEVVEEIWRQGGKVGSVPPVDIGPRPQRPMFKATDECRAEYTHAIRTYIAEQQAYSIVHAQGTLFNLKLHLAQQFRNEESIYFPHSLDFRGRAYPVPSLLNHQGDDLCRGLLKFATARPLGEQGLRWFKIHLAGMFGHDKKSFDERVAWTDSQEETIRRVAADPLGKESKEVWTNADKPWQALANILEMANILSSPDPVNFMSQMPVHQDGTCNGLQHYAALGRDIDGGKAVNLLPSEYPQDVYMLVLEACKKKLQKMVETVDTLSEKYCLARLILDKDLLVRKVVKTPLMTLCYGVTSFGARDQVKRKLNDLFGERINLCEYPQLSGFISSIILSSVDDIFRNAMKIQKWLDQVASHTARQHIRVSWISPTGLPCRQPYVKNDTRQIMTTRQKIIISTRSGNSLINASKQKASFSPNYIHSLDASHMLMTAAKCYDNAVHDSFWTHAGDVPLMNKFLREEFYNMHDKHSLEDLFFANSCRGIKGLTPPPEVGNLDLKEVLKSPYFFC